MIGKIGKSGYVYKEGEDVVERLRNKLSTVFLVLESSKCEDDIIKEGIKVIPDILMLLEDFEALLRGKSF